MSGASWSEPCRCRPWRRTRLAHWLATQLYVSGATASGASTIWGGGHEWCVTMPSFNLHPRVYVLWVGRGTWRCLRRGHLRGEVVGFDMCAKCVPWPCCGAKTVAHADGCVSR